ncbi:C1orf123 family protein [Megaselia abdita]
MSVSQCSTQRIDNKEPTNMVRIGLQISAVLENVETLKTCYPDYPFFVKIKCTNCGELDEKFHDIIESEKNGQTSRVPDGFNFYMKCKMCSRENSIDIVEKSNGSYFFFLF